MSPMIPISQAKIYAACAIAAAIAILSLIGGIKIGHKMGYNTGYESGQEAKKKEIDAQINTQNEALKKELAKAKEDSEGILGKLNVANQEVDALKLANAKRKAAIPRTVIVPNKKGAPDEKPTVVPAPDFVITAGYVWLWNRSLHYQGGQADDPESLLGANERASGLDRRTQVNLGQEALLDNTSENAARCEKDRRRFRSLQVQICKLGLAEEGSPCTTILDPANKAYANLN